MPRKVSGMPVAVAIVVAALAGACGTSGTPKANAGPPAITHQQARKEYLDEATKWSLPSGWRWPDGQIYSGQGPDGTGMVYEPTTGKVDSTHFWFCAWSRALLGAHSQADRAAALKQVSRLPETPFYQVGLLSGDQSHYNSILTGAKAGDLQPLAEVTEPNCPKKPS
jgi:hypothetical protein